LIDQLAHHSRLREDVAVKVEDIGFAPTHPGELRLLQPFHISWRSDHMRGHNDQQLGTLIGVVIIAEQVLDDRDITEERNLAVERASAF
jgi:hypothetical protein